jgi:hypothetical protein
MYMEVRYDENAGSVFSSMYMEVRYDENAGSVFRRCDLTFLVAVAILTFLFGVFLQ